jgi:hypothetical protein
MYLIYFISYVSLAFFISAATYPGKQAQLTCQLVKALTHCMFLGLRCVRGPIHKFMLSGLVLHKYV